MDSIPVLGENDFYKFLGKYESVKQLEEKVMEEASKEYEKRLHAIWSSPISIPRKVKAANTFAVPVLLYHMWTTDWQINKLKQLDITTRRIMSESGGKHKFESNYLIYLPTSKGGKGLINIENLYKTTKIKTAHYISTSKDPHIELVNSFQKHKEDRNLRSIIKDGIKFGQELNITCEFSGVTQIDNGEEILETDNKEPKAIN